jgi:hypothetical protein
VERLVDRFLPYFSIALNVLLVWHLIQSGDRVGPIAYGTKYVSVVLRSFDLSFL